MDSFSSNEYSAKAEWFVLKNGNHVGPITLDKIFLYFESGQVNEKTLVWKGGHLDWLPIGDLKEFEVLFSQKNVLPSLPDLREIEIQAREEIEKNYPQPCLKEARVLKKNKADSRVIDKYKNSSSSNDHVAFESKIDPASSVVFDTQILPELPTFVLPEIPGELVNEPSTSPSGEGELQVNEDSVIYREESTSGNLSPDKFEASNSRRSGRQFLFIFIVALIFLVPSIVYLQGASPLTIKLPYAKKHQISSLEKTLNLKGGGEPILSAIIDERGRMFLAVNIKSPVKLFGKIKSMTNQITSLSGVSFYFKESSKNGLVEIRSPRFEVESTTFPFAGRYFVDVQIEKTDKISTFMSYLKKVFLLQDIPLIKNFTTRKRYSGDIIIGKGTESENEKLISDFLKNRNQYIEKPIMHLQQQLQTLSSIGGQFKELFFNATTVRTLAQSKKIFARQFGRELAPILQVISLSDLSEVDLDPSKLNKSYIDVFDAEFERVKLISREISGLAAFVDKRFSDGGKWFSSKRIKHRSLVNNEVRKIQEQIDGSLKVIETLKERFLIKI